MALVRVYCGLASADPADRPASAGSTLTSAVVDDAGRLLHVCEIGDDPAGYAQLVALLVERSGGPSGAAIAADSDDHTVTSLLSAAGRPLAIADDDSVDDFAERFADDDSLEEMQSPPAERQAVGLARALQAGALSAVTLPAPRDLTGYKQVLAAHAALASGRHSAAVALREVLRELYPAALRAYPDPAEPVALAVLDALPEPSMLGGTIGRGREMSIAADAIAAHLAADGVADADEINDAVTALQVAISETPRRAAVSRALTSAVAETVRQAVASVRACDAGCEALVSALGARATNPAQAPGRRAAARRGEPVDELAGLGVTGGLRATAHRARAGRPPQPPRADPRRRNAALAPAPRPTAERTGADRPAADRPTPDGPGRHRRPARLRTAVGRRPAPDGGRPDQPAGVRAAAPAAGDDPVRAGPARAWLGAAGRGRRAVPAHADHRRDPARPGGAATHRHPAPAQDHRRARPTHRRVQRHRPECAGPDPAARPGVRSPRLPGELAAGQQPRGPVRQRRRQPGRPVLRGPGAATDRRADGAGAGRRSGHPALARRRPAPGAADAAAGRAAAAGGPGAARGAGPGR